MSRISDHSLSTRKCDVNGERGSLAGQLSFILCDIGSELGAREGHEVHLTGSPKAFRQLSVPGRSIPGRVPNLLRHAKQFRDLEGKHRALGNNPN